MKCIRPDCQNELHSGKRYCSTGCAAKDRQRAKLEKQNETVSLEMPRDLSTKLDQIIGADNRALVISEVNRYLAEADTKVLASIPMPLMGQTYGDLVLSYDGKKDYRPSTTLSFDVIEKMLRSGPVVFAMEMKRAQVFRVFSQGRYKVVSPDTELADVAKASLDLIMPKMMHDVTYSAFAFGTSFSEEVWEWKTKYQLGMIEKASTEAKSGSPIPAEPKKPAGDKNTKFLVPKVPNSVNPATVDHILRTEDGSFDGFAQKRKLDGTSITSIDPIIVNREQALVIPVNERFRNLWGESTLKPMYVLWLWYEVVFRTMVKYMDRMAIPWKVATAPARQTVTVSGSSAPVRAMDLALALAANLDKSGAVAIPSDVDENGKPLWDLKLLTAESRVTLFLEVLQYLSQEMIRAALSADRSLSQSSGGVGSYNIGEVHAAASAITSEMLLLQFVYYLNAYFMPEFSLYNRGKDGPPIWLRTQSIDTQERELLMQLIGVAGNSPAAQELFYIIDWRILIETGNVPALSEDAVTKLKEELNKEATDKMEKQQEIMAKNSVPVAKGGASAFPEKNAKKPSVPEPTAVKTESDDITVALENIFTHQIPWMLGERECVALYEAGLVGDEVVRLFNPFHSRADGKFTSGRSGGGIGIVGGGGNPAASAVAEATKSDTLQKAAKSGSLVRTTGTVLGITGLGLTGLVILGALRKKRDPSVRIVIEGEVESIKGDQEQLTQQYRNLEQEYKDLLPPNARIPKGLTVEQYTQMARDSLHKMGIEDIYDGPMKVASGVTLEYMRNVGGAGMFAGPSNEFYITPEMAAGLQNGDRFPFLVVTHELAHSNQEGFSQVTDSIEKGFAVASGSGESMRQLFEGQNDLYARMAMSQTTGIPESTETSKYLDLMDSELRNKMNNTYNELDDAHKSTVSPPPNDFGPANIDMNWNSYQPYVYTWAAMTLAAERNGTPVKQYMNTHHSYGMTVSGQAAAINEVLPGAASAGLGGIGASIPDANQVSDMIRQQYGIDGQQAYEELMQRAASGGL